MKLPILQSKIGTRDTMKQFDSKTNPNTYQQGFNDGLLRAADWLEETASRVHPDHELKRQALKSAAYAIRNSKVDA